MASEIVMFDSVDLSQIPAAATALAAYVNGRFANSAEARDRFPHAEILTIAVTSGADAACLDIETGDATPADAAGWYARQKARGVTRPCLYASASVMQSAVIPAIRAAGITRSSVRLWSAHYTGSPHICSGTTCGATSIPMDGTQWTDRALGRDLDESLLAADFFGAPSPPAVPAWETAMLAALPTMTVGWNDANLPHWYVRRVQALANAIYHVSPAVAEDGVFGAATKVAVEAIQRQAKITADGVVGPATWSVILTGSAP